LLGALDHLGLQELEKLKTKFCLALRRGFDNAAKVLSIELRRELSFLADDIDRLNQAFDRWRFDLPTEKSLREEIDALEEEFDEVEWDRREISVCTPPITLEDVHLGAFRLSISWDNIFESLRVGALNPNPAAGDESVIHPHVKDNELCPGEAAGPMLSALVDARLADFFTIVRRTLETYNPRSPHVSLENWDSAGCENCGSAASCSCQYCAAPL